MVFRLIKKRREQELRKWCVEQHFSMVRNEWIIGIDYDSFYHYIKDGNKSEQTKNTSHD